MKTDFQVSIKERSAHTLYGASVRTNMAKASTDCPHIWESVFVPRMPEISQKPLKEFQGESYGISIVVDMQSGIFDYWAAMEPAPGTPLPQGLSEIEIPAGLYASCRVDSLEQLGDAYNYLYTEWVPKQPNLLLNMQAPCFELYGQEYMQNGALEVYVPVLKK